MLLDRLNTFFTGKRYTAIEVFTNSDSKNNYAVSQITKSKDELNLIATEIEESIPFKLIKQQQTPVILVINTNKVLVKTLDFVESNEAGAFKKAFPGLNADDFYFEAWSGNNKTIVYIVRRDYINEILTKFDEIEPYILKISIGSSVISSVFSYFKSEKNIYFNFGAFDCNQLSSSNNLTHSNSFSLDNVLLDNTNILGFSATVDFLDSKKAGNIQEANNQLKNTFFQNAFFKKVSVYGVYFFLGVLLINYFFFSHYFDNYNSLSGVKEIMIEKNEKIDLLKKEVLKKEALLKNISLTKNKASYYINEICKTIPNSVLLNDLYFNPVLKKQNEENLAEFESNMLIVSGVTNSNTEFSTWINELSRLDVVQDVSISDFKEKENKTTFTLKLKLNETEH